MYVEGTAYWRKAVTTTDSQEIRAETKGVEIEVSRYDGVKKGSFMFADSSTASVYLGLRTRNPICSEIRRDDMIEFEGETFSVTEVQQLRSCAFLGDKEYVIWLH